MKIKTNFHQINDPLNAGHKKSIKLFGNPLKIIQNRCRNEKKIKFLPHEQRNSQMTSNSNEK